MYVHIAHKVISEMVASTAHVNMTNDYWCWKHTVLGVLRMRAHMLTHMHAYTHIHTYTHMHAHTHTQTQAHTHTDRHRHTHTHRVTHTHTNTHSTIASMVCITIHRPLKILHTYTHIDSIIFPYTTM